MILAIVLTLLQIAQPIPDPVPNGDEVVAGPLDNLLQGWIDKRLERTEQASDRQYHGLLSGVKEAVANGRESIQSSLQASKDARDALQAAREAKKSTEQSTGPIRESIALLYKLVMACVMLVGLLVLLRIVDFIAPLIKRPIQ
jgi:hypothetical protein